MTFVLPLKTESCPVHNKESPSHSPESSYPVIQHCLDQCSVPGGSFCSRSSPDDEDFPVLRESPAALKAQPPAQRLSMRKMNPVPEESSSASSASSVARNVSSNLQLLSSYVELLSNNIELNTDHEGFQMIPPPVSFSGSDLAPTGLCSDTELMDLSGNSLPKVQGYDVTIRSSRPTAPHAAPQVTVPVLRTFGDVGHTDKSCK